MKASKSCRMIVMSAPRHSLCRKSTDCASLSAQWQEHMTRTYSVSIALLQDIIRLLRYPLGISNHRRPHLHPLLLLCCGAGQRLEPAHLPVGGDALAGSECHVTGGAVALTEAALNAPGTGKQGLGV